MNARLKNLFARVKSLGMGMPKEYISLFRHCGASTYLCNYWNQDRLEAHHKTHPGRVLSVGCPLISEKEWCVFGSGSPDEIVEPKERPCETCEYAQVRY